MYKTVIADLDGIHLEEVPAKNLQYGFTLNKPGAATFVLPKRHPLCTPQILACGEREVLIFRDGVKVWGGRLWTAQVGSDEETIRFSAEGWFSTLRRRYIDVDKVYTAQDQTTQIAWDLINFTQSKTGGGLGITNGSVASGVLRDRTYPANERKFIGEAIEQLAAVDNGFDFDIDAHKVFRTYYPKKGANIPFIFELGKNIRGYGVQYDATRVATEFTAIGDTLQITEEQSAHLLSVASDTASRDTFGLLQASKSFTDVSVQSTLDDHAQEELRLLKEVFITPQIQAVTNDPPFGSYTVGDQCEVRMDEGYVKINDTFRISSINIQVSNEGFEAVGLNFDEATL